MRLCLPFLFFWLLLGFVSVSAAELSKKPNILFLFTDDMRADCIGALGHPVVKTPHVDSLVQRGFVFENAFCLGSDQGAVCTPSRNMLLSGRAYFRWAGSRLAPADGPNLPVALKQAGYETWHLGKKGNTALNIQASFEHNHYLANDEAERLSGDPGKECADGAIKFLTADRDKSRPFFMYVAFGNPHDPRVASEKYLSQYSPDKIPLPKNYLPQHPFKIGSEVVRDELLAPFPRTPEVIREHLRDYYAVMTCLDDHIGRVLQTLKEQGLEENTIIVFSSDHGLSMGSHGLMGKQNVYDAGYNAPLIFAGPGISQGKSKAMCYLLDIMPTLCDLGGASLTQSIDGRSLLPVIRGEKASIRDSLLLTYMDTQRALRQDEWKLIRYPLVNKTQLFNVKTDPDEIHDLAADSAQASRIETMTAAMKMQQAALGDTAPLTVENPASANFVQPTAAEIEALQAKPKKKQDKRGKS